VAPTEAATLPTTGGGSTGNLLALSLGVALTGAALVLATRRRARHRGAV
jgi:LPXTG-motif cell wall-anchored protein